MRKLLKESANVLEEIKAEAIMSAILALLSVIILGSIAALSVSVNIKIILVCSSPLIFVLLTVVYTLIIKQIRKSLVWLSEYTLPAPKFPRFKTSIYGDEEIYIKVFNSSWLIDTRNVFLKSGFSANLDPVDSSIKWLDNPSVHVDIPKRKYKILHFATVNKKSGEFHVHTKDRDISFPYREDGYELGFILSGKTANVHNENFGWLRFSIVAKYSAKNKVNFEIR